MVLIFLFGFMNTDTIDNSYKKVYDHGRNRIIYWACIEKKIRF